MKLDNFYVDDKMVSKALMSSIDDYIHLGDLTTNVFFVSQNMYDDFDLPGRLVEDLVNVWGKLIHEKDKERYFKSIDDMLAGKADSHNEEYQIRNRKGQYVWVHCKGCLYRDPQTQAPLSFIGIVKKPSSLGKVDSITGLLAHETFQETLQNLSADGMLDNAGFMILGIDNFTKINTLKTHHFGDIVLRNTAQDLTGLLPESVQLYRFDGDQFAIFTPDGTRCSLRAIYETIQAYTSHSHSAEGQTYDFTMSAGAVRFADISDIDEKAEKCAAIALKEAKANGKNQCVFFEESMLDYKVREQAILQDLQESIADNYAGYHLVYQPIADAATLRIIGAEALLRYQSKTYGALYPDEFIHLLENSGLILPVGRWVLSEAIKMCAKWRQRIPEFVMSVNVSCLQLKDDDFPHIVETELEKAHLPADSLILEMTESYFVSDSDIIADALSKLRKLGCNIAMDDFGTGYSSLGRLTNFNIDIVKIDRLFVQQLYANHFNQSFIEAVIRLCHSAGMKVCVEGVETCEEQQSISSLYSDTLQGYFFSKPIPPQSFEENFIAQPDCMGKYAIKEELPPYCIKMSSNKDLLLMMMDAVPLGFNLWNHNYQNVECNHAAVKMFDLLSEEEYLDHFYDLSPEYQPDGTPSMQKAKEYISKAFEKGSCVFYWQHQKLNGEPMPCEVTLVRIRYKNEYLVAGYTRDLRRQLRIEALCDSKCHVYDPLPEAVMIFDIAKHACVYANPFMLEFVDAKAYPLQLDQFLMPPLSMKELIDLSCHQLNIGKRIFTFEFNLLIKGKPTPVLASSTYLSDHHDYLMITLNRTELKPEVSL